MQLKGILVSETTYRKVILINNGLEEGRTHRDSNSEHRTESITVGVHNDVKRKKSVLRMLHRFLVYFYPFRVFYVIFRVFEPFRVFDVISRVMSPKPTRQKYCACSTVFSCIFTLFVYFTSFFVYLSLFVFLTSFLGLCRLNPRDKRGALI